MSDALPITPLPQFEADLAEHLAEQEDREVYERLRAPTTVVIRHGLMGLIAELPYKGDAKPGCGSKLVARTTRGTEVGEMLTSTCPNAGCSKSVTRKEMLEYIDRSGGRDYPFSDKGQILRIATKEDLDAQAALDADRFRLRGEVSRLAKDLGFGAKIVEVEQILGGERLTVYVASEQRVEARPLSDELEKLYRTRVMIRPVGARDEARLTADYERCGQHCCCKNFLKVLKPISMRSAKQQKATLEPLKISGRCGRLMCCLRYEDSTYQDLKANLPNRKTRVGTPEGDGIVIDSQILTQLVLIELDSGTRVAIPVEELTPPESKTAPMRDPEAQPARGMGRTGRPGQGGSGGAAAPRGSRSERPDRTDRAALDRSAQEEPQRGGEQSSDFSIAGPEEGSAAGDGTRKKRRRKRRKKPASGGEALGGATGDTSMDERGGDDERSAAEVGGADGADAQGATDGPSSAARKKRRRRRKRRGGGEQGQGEGGATGPGSPESGVDE